MNFFGYGDGNIFLEKSQWKTSLQILKMQVKRVQLLQQGQGADRGGGENGIRTQVEVLKGSSP